VTDLSEDREIDKARYNERAERVLALGTSRASCADGAISISPELRAPYLEYEAFIRSHAHLGSEILDVCCGDGLHSLVAAKAGSNVTASDIAENNLMLVKARALRAGVKITTVVANAERVPLPDSSFDVVTCAGSLSYLDHSKVLAEIHRVLKDEGVFICVDSLNHNPLYRFNRWIHYLLGDRTKSTLLRMPTMRVFEEFEREIGPVVYRSFHGIFSFLIPLLKPLLGAPATRRVLDYLDLSFPALRSQSFKFVAVVQKKTKTLPLKPS
jgi:2-polyprenyl-3-methyl-5-hydroxy-6-metoxy-1,4-benzoquinol methylase